MGTNYLGSALANQEPRERTPEEVMVGSAPVKLSPEAAAANRRALRRVRGNYRTVETAVYREDPSGEEHEVLVTVEYSMQGAEPDVGIMSGYLEVQGVYLTNEDGSEGPLLDWSDTDQSDFDEGVAIDCAEAFGEYDGPDTIEEARGER